MDINSCAANVDIIIKKEPELDLPYDIKIEIDNCNEETDPFVDKIDTRNMNTVQTMKNSTELTSRIELNEAVNNLIQLYKCPKCDDRFDNINHLKIHYVHHLTKKKITKYKCLKCMEEFKSVEQLASHMVSEHLDDLEKLKKKMTCPRCNISFSNSDELTEHIKKHRDKYRCKKCNKTFPHKNFFKQHYKQNHMGNKLEKKDEHSYKCKLCNFRLKSRDEMIQHYNIHKLSQQKKRIEQTINELDKQEKQTLPTNNVISSSTSTTIKNPSTVENLSSLSNVIVANQNMIKQLLEKALDGRNKTSIYKEFGNYIVSTLDSMETRYATILEDKILEAIIEVKEMVKLGA